MTPEPATKRRTKWSRVVVPLIAVSPLMWLVADPDLSQWWRTLGVTYCILMGQAVRLAMDHAAEHPDRAVSDTRKAKQ